MSKYKIITLEELKQKRRNLIGTVVATNGCFDLLGAHHVEYLEQCKKLGYYLIVGVNGDESVRVLKGEGRPIHPETDRARILAGLESVDYVCIFPEIRATNFLKIARPTVYAKAEDYNFANMDKGELAVLEQNQTKIEFIPLIPDKSTTRTINTVITKNT